jgi:Ca-activated chloride channel homolog
MRKLLRGRHGAGTRLRVIGPSTRVAGAIALALLVSALGARVAGSNDLDAVIHITSPLGRTGLPGTIRIVARIDGASQSQPPTVQFFVDDKLLSSDTDGPPYDATWEDDNPFEARKLRVEAALSSGRTLSDTLELKPLEITEVASVTSVLVDAVVFDSKGRYVKDLTDKQFTVSESGEPQTLEFARQERDPALFALLVDSSQSMAIRSDAVRAAAARLLAPLGKDDEVIVAPFTKSLLSVTGPTTDRNTILDAIGTIRPKGGTAILDALTEATGSLSASTRRKAIVLITDGYDENSSTTIEQADETLKKSGITLYVVGLGGIAGISLKGEHLLKGLAEDSGGRAWFPRDERDLVVAYDAIANEVKHRYVLGYTPTNQNHDGTWRPIEVKVADETYKVRARKGYTAPIPPPVRASLEFTGVGKTQSTSSLTRDDVVVIEDGVPQQVDVFQEAVLPVTFVLALDASGSMKKSAAQAQEAAREFITAMRPEDELATMLFATKTNLVHKPTKERAKALEAVQSYVADGGTALYDAVYESLEQLSSIQGRRVVVLVTDGRDENAPSTGPGSLRTFEEVLEKVQQTEAAVYAVGIGSNVDHDRLKEIAKLSGGDAYFPKDVTTLAADYQRILDELRRRYVVGYESTNHTRDGRWRTVQIKPRRQDVEIRSRGGYYAPPQ